MPLPQGILELLKWARANGCPWTTATTELATERRRKEVLLWAIEEGASVAPHGKAERLLKAMATPMLLLCLRNRRIELPRDVLAAILAQY